MVGEDEPLFLFGCEPVFDEGHVEVFVAAIELVANDGMTDMREMNADLVLAASVRENTEQGEVALGASEAALDGEVGVGCGAVGADAVLNGDAAVAVFAERIADAPLLFLEMAVDDGPVFLADGAVFPEPAQFAGRFVAQSNEYDTAGLAVEAVHKVGPGTVAQMNADTADEAGPGIALGGMADEAGGLVDDKQVSILVDDFKQ